jgi:Homologues of TraJ from Bacteroides conjugative transposon
MLGLLNSIIFQKLPSVTKCFVHAGRGNTLLYKVTSLTSSSSRNVVNSVSSGAGMVADSFGNTRSTVAGSMASNGVSGGYFNDKKDDGRYMKDRLSGKT